jgi:hypothetical protein
MMHEYDSDKLADLFAQIERAWLDLGDRQVVRILSEQHPELSEELYEFFAELVLGSDESNDKFAKAEERVDDWLTNSAFEIAKAATIQSRSMMQTTSGASKEAKSEGGEATVLERDLGTCSQTGLAEGKSWIVCLKTRTKQTLPCLASKLTNVTTEYLVLVSRHPSIVPNDVKTCIAEEVRRAWGVPVKESFECLRHDPEIRRAASRAQPFTDDPKTFPELLDRTSLSPEQKAFWLQRAKTS